MGGTVLKPEIDDSLCVCVCVRSPGTYYIYSILYLFMCIVCVCLQETCKNQRRESRCCVFLYEFIWGCGLCACKEMHTFIKTVYERALHSPDPTAPFCFLSFNFPLLVTSGSPLTPPGFSAGPWPPGSLTESWVVQIQSCLGTRLAHRK